MKRTILFVAGATLLFIFMGSSTLNAQPERLTKKANEFFAMKEYVQAIPYYREALISDNSLDNKVKLAHSYRLTGQSEKAEYWYRLLEPQIMQYKENEFYYAQVLQQNEKYSEAAEWYRKYAAYDESANTYAKACDNYLAFYQNERDYQVYNIPFNMESSDFSPVYFEDGIVFTSTRTSNKPKTKITYAEESPSLNLYFTRKLPGNSFLPPKKIKGKINTSNNEGPCTFGYRDTEIWFTRNTKARIKNGQLISSGQTLDLFSAQKSKSGAWENEVPFQHNSPEYSIAHPSLSSDGQTLFFVSDMPGGAGGTDIYMCHRLDSLWSAPINLGAEINTAENEMYPTVHKDGTLYFASIGLAGMGGYDLYETKRVDGQWTQPKNLGAPLNSPKDDFTIVFNGNKTEGYLSSNRKGSQGQDDLYGFRKVSISATDLEEAPESNFKGEDQVIVSNSQGNYVAEADPEFGYGSVLNEQLAMAPIDFDFKQSHLTFAASSEIDKLIAHLKDRPLKTVTIEAHTDAQGDAEFNMTLSQVRAKNIRDYMLSKGTRGEQLEAIGYGEKFIINECREGVECSEEKHRANRRIVFRESSPNMIVDSTQELADATTVSTPDAAPVGQNTTTPSTQFDPPKKMGKIKKPKVKKEPRERGTKIKPPKPEKVKKPKVKKEPKPRGTKIKPPKAEKTVKPAKTKTPKPSKPAKANTPAVKDIKPPMVMTTTDPAGLKYKIIVGPYNNFSPAMQTALDRMDIDIDYKDAEGGQWASLGYFSTIGSSERALKYLKACGMKSAQIVAFADGNQTDYNIKKLKKEGLK